MDKKDIYEHLAKIYLDASSKKKKKSESHSPLFKKPFFIIIVFIFVFGVSLFIALQKDKNLASQKNRKFTSEIALVLLSDVKRINFNFDPAKKEIYSINLNNLDLTHFKAIGFSVRKANYEDNIILKIEFDTGREKSEIYLRDIPSFKWRDNKIPLSDFKNISNWSGALNLAFIIEELNVREKKGIVYIDNVRLLR